MIITLLAFLLSFSIALFSVPSLMSFAKKVGLVDHPDKHRKLHTDSIPMVGGLALIIASTTTVIFIFATSINQAINGWVSSGILTANLSLEEEDYVQLMGLFVGGVVLLLVGLADDRFGIRGRQKLLGQIVAATVLILSGFRFEYFEFLGYEIEFGVFSVLFIYAWILAAINSVNLLDGADGIATTIGLVMSTSIAALSFWLGMYVDAIIAIAIAGALLGFLNYNFPPAKAYLGDSGSMLIGYFIGALAIRCMFKQTFAYAFFAPLALLAIPFIDTFAAIIRRRLTGRSIFTVDRGHLHHTLMKRGYSPRVSLLWVALLCTTTAAGGVLAFINKQSEYAIVSIAVVLGVMTSCRIFGLAEFQLVSRKTSTLAKSFFRVPNSDSPNLLQSSVHVQGSHDWQEVWKVLCDFADEHNLRQLTMDLNAPWLHESFHATLKRPEVRRGESNEWFAEVPLVSRHRVFGRIEVLGVSGDRITHHEVIENLIKVSTDIEQLMVETEFGEHAESNPVKQTNISTPSTSTDSSGTPLSSA